MEDAPGFAVHWAGQLGARVRSLDRLRGGINNQVFRCSDGKHHWVIKGYAPAKPGQRDRMQAEVDFLRFAAQAAPGFTPALLQVDPERRCVVLEHLEGEAFPEGLPPSEGEVGEAVEFFRQLNAEPRLARESIQLDAAEGFLSLREHLGNVRQRLEGMGCAHLEAALRPQAETLLQQLHTELAHTEERTTSLIDQGLVADAIAPEARCVSPSDFGFHNAVRTPQGSVFLDFEFSGWDDPCKTSIDFILQPRVPLCRESTYLLSVLPIDRHSHTERRCKFLEPILRLKWIAIIVSIFNPCRLDAILLATPTLDPQKLTCDRIISAQVAMKVFSDFSDPVKNL
ncbi:MAG: phosphotransferase [Synechococcaceae cyanobacterium ELA739]